MLLNSTSSFHELDNKQQKSINNELEELVENAKREKWWIREKELKISKLPFAEGAFSEIFDCEWRGLDIVIKKPKKKQLRLITDIMREVRVWNTIRHPHIVQFLGFSVTDHNIYILLEKIHGSTLKHYVDQRKRMCSFYYTRNYDTKIVIDLVKVFYFLHHATPQIIYRDLKPENILIGENGLLKLTDLGLSKFIKNEDSNACLMTGNTGTLRWMAPEVFNGHLYHVSADIYSLGLLIHYIMSKEKPFANCTSSVAKNFFKNPDDTLLRFVSSTPTKYSECVKQCIQIDPRKRYDIKSVYEFILKRNKK